MEGGFWRRLLRTMKSMQRRSGVAKIQNLSGGVGDSLASKKVLHELRRGACVWILGVKYEFPKVNEEWKKGCDDINSEIEQEDETNGDGSPRDGIGDAGEVGTTAQAWAEVCEELFWDVKSRIWIMYRQNFEPLGKNGLETDVGWGCTLRSGQMMLAQALCFLRLGRAWRLRHLSFGDMSDQAEDEDDTVLDLTGEILEMLEMFFDKADNRSMFSLHQIFQRTAQALNLHARPGQWLGPAAVSQLLAEALNSCQDLGLRGCVLSDMGGGAPTLSSKILSHQSAKQMGQSMDNAWVAPGAGLEITTPILIFIPLVLGIDGLNEAYIPQLRVVLSWKWTVGFVGGTGGSSVYVIGTSHTGAPILMDPHTVKKAAVGYEDASSFFDADARVLEWSELDSSLCLGFLCQHRDDVECLCQCFLDLQREVPHAPLAYVCEDREPLPHHKLQEHGASVSMALDGSSSCIPPPLEDEDWQLL